MSLLEGLLTPPLQEFLLYILQGFLEIKIEAIFIINIQRSTNLNIRPPNLIFGKIRKS